MQEVKLLSERQEVLAGLVEDNSRLQSKATDKALCNDLRGDEGVGREKVERSLGTRTEEAHFIRMSKREGKSKKVANIGRIESDKTLDWPTRDHVR